MAARMALAVIGLLAVAADARAEILRLLHDEWDDVELVEEVAENERVIEFRKELRNLSREIAGLEQEDVERLFGKPAEMAPKTYALPIAQRRLLIFSGFGLGHPSKWRKHREFYPVGDAGGVKVWYGTDGKTAQTAVFYLKVGDGFSRLTRENWEDRLRWDRDQFSELQSAIEELRKKKR